MNLGERRFRIMSKQLVRYRYAWLTTLSMTLLLALVLNVTAALAGGFLVKDDAGLLSASDKNSLQSNANSLPFSVQVLTSKNYSSQSQFDSYVKGQLQGPTYIIIGISDGAYRGTHVEIGTGTGINASNAGTIAGAGDSNFRSSNWRNGIAAIMQSAAGFSTLGRSSSSNTSSGSTNVTVVNTKESGSSVGVIIAVIVVIIILIVVASIFFGRRRGSSGFTPAPPMQTYNPGPSYNPGPTYNNYGPGPGYNNGGGMGAVGGGVIGAVGGGVVGYELGKAAGEREERNREGFYNNPGGNYGGNYNNAGNNNGWDAGGGDSNWGGNNNNANTGSSGWDAGGGDSNWGGNNSGGSSWGGGDSGGSTSFDSGGSWGGGGGDSGGGGGDSGSSSW
jgi:hypothetical protein